MLFGQICALWGSGEPLMILPEMASLLAATTHAPIMATLMVCEMTGEFTLLSGILLTCVFAATLSRGLRPQSVYRQNAAQAG